MAAYTTFSDEALARYLAMFDQGELIDWSPVAGGIENSNYFITLQKGEDRTRWVLTIVEGFDFSETAFFARLLTHLHHYGLPVAAPISTLDGMNATIFCGKPAFLLPRLAGKHVTRATIGHCRQLGHFMARSHKAMDELTITRNNPYPASWMHETLKRHRHRISHEHAALLDRLIKDYEHLSELDLPRGLIHGDLFLDNALFDEDDQLCGVIDFYHACNDLLIQDLAIAINDWCVTGNRIDHALRQAMLEGYADVRPLTADEIDTLPSMQQVSAARFALTRLLSGDPPLKDPAQMLDLVGQIN